MTICEKSKISSNPEDEGCPVARALSLFVLPAALIYLEILTAVLSGFDFTAYKPASAVLCALSFGLIFSAICVLTGKRGLGKWLCFIIAELFCIYYCVEFFLNNSYQTFLNLQTIIGGAGKVMDEFGEDIKTLIMTGYSIILAYQVPAFIILFLNIIKKTDFTPRRGLKFSALILAAICAGSIAEGSLAMDSSSAAKYTYEFNFTDGVKNFGVMAATKADSQYALLGMPQAPKSAAVLRASRGSGVSEQPPFHGLNKLDIDFEALIAKAPNKTVKDLHSYVSSLKASNKNAYTGLFEGKNLIYICAESLNIYGISEETMPTTYRMMTKGIVFEDAYQPFWGGHTTAGEYAALLGNIPVHGTESIQMCIGNNNALTLGTYFQKLGYRSVAYHNGDYDFYNRYKTHPWLGFSEFYAQGQGMDDPRLDSYPPSDVYMMEDTIEDYIDAQPFYTYYMSYSGHSLWNFRRHAQAQKHQEQVENLPYSDTVKAFIAANMEFDDALTYLIEKLDEAGILENTVFAICPDHYPYALQNSMIWGNTRDYVSELYGFDVRTEEERDRNCLIIWSPVLEEMEPIVVSEPASSIDMVPTLCNLFGFDFDSRLYTGRDVLGNSTPVVMWNSFSWKTDKGFYNASTGKFTPKEGESVDDSYISEIKELVRGKINYSRNEITSDYYKYIFE